MRLDVFYRFLGGVGAASGSDLQRAPFEEQARAGVAEAVQGGAAQRVRCAGAALVEDQQVARAERRGQRLGDEFAERQRRLARAARQREDRGLARARWAGRIRRSTLSEIVPGTGPERSSGTGTVAHEKAEVLAQGANVSAPAVARPKMAGTHRTSAAASGSVSARLDILADVTGQRTGLESCISRNLPAAVRRRAIAPCSLGSSH